MKAKSVIFFVACALITLSFTFVSVKDSQDKATNSTTSTTDAINSAPVGGLVSEDK